MDESLKQGISQYFKGEFADTILKNLKTGHNLSDFQINPFVLTALSSGVLGKLDSVNMAKALLYPRILGTSISTKFGEKMQKLCVKYLGASASSTPGMDIEFDDKIEPQRIIMQLKAGPNTINSGDVEPILTDMSSAYRLLQQNRTSIMPTFAIGITYGELGEISGHYKKINSSPVGAQKNVAMYIGQDFWHRLTGNPDFYAEMISIFIDLFEKEDYSKLLKRDLKKLSDEIEKKYFTNGKFDITKI